MGAWMEHPVAGKHRVTGPPVEMSETPSNPTTAAPLLGQHTASALTELLGLDSKTVDRLMADGVIPVPPGLEESTTPQRNADDANGL
jgi:crotonobetainyl-CoA:carnitine CoA-transferase CaiB-like acyl-CoA transferase